MTEIRDHVSDALRLADRLDSEARWLGELPDAGGGRDAALADASVCLRELAADVAMLSGELNLAAATAELCATVAKANGDSLRRLLTLAMDAIEGIRSTKACLVHERDDCPVPASDGSAGRRLDDEILTTFGVPDDEADDEILSTFGARQAQRGNYR